MGTSNKSPALQSLVYNKPLYDSNVHYQRRMARNQSLKFRRKNFLFTWFIYRSRQHPTPLKQSREKQPKNSIFAQIQQKSAVFASTGENQNSLFLCNFFLSIV